MIVNGVCVDNPAEPCPTCGAKIGRPHRLNRAGMTCPLARCAVCGGQLMACDCDGRGKPWTGHYPGVAGCVALGWPRGAAHAAKANLRWAAVGADIRETGEDPDVARWVETIARRAAEFGGADPDELEARGERMIAEAFREAQP